MSKRKFGFEGFGLNRQARHTFDRPEAPQRLYMPSSNDNYEDADLDNIEYDQPEGGEAHNAMSAADDGEIDPLDAFMVGIHDEISKAPVPAPSSQKVFFFFFFF
jgi:ATP-dependent RNA helicase DDX42